MKHGDGFEVQGLLLAAGSSRRMGRQNKLLIPVGGTPMVRCSALALRPALDTLAVVTGHQQERIRQALKGLDVRFVDNPDYKTGLGSSLSAGVRALPATADGLVVGLADMPFLLTTTVSALVEAFRGAPSHVTVPVYDGARGHPVIWPQRCFAALRQATGDAGGRALLLRETVVEVPVDDPGILKDVDTSDDWPEAGAEPAS